MTLPKSGDLLFIGREASVQFAGDRVLRLRVVSVDSGPPITGGCG